MQVAQLAPGLWRWTARHPDWTPEQGGPDGWEAEVGCVYAEAGGDVLLIDPLAPPEGSERERFWRALDRDVARAGTPHVLLTCAWHARSAAAVVERYPNTRLWTHADGAAALPDGLRATDGFRPGDLLPGGVQAIEGAVGDGPPQEVLLWLASHRALVAGDALLGDGAGGIRVCPDSWLGDADPAAVRAELRARLERLPVELVLPAHGAPVLERAREALGRALG